MSDTRTEGQKLEERLLYKRQNIWEKVDEEYIKKAFDFCEDYKSFLNTSKTEREFAANTEKLAVAAGFRKLDDLISSNTRLKPGDKVYHINRKKSAVLAVVGNKPLSEGVNILGSHIDAPRLDLKQNPLYEDTQMAFFKTHYYGGIKKYQWLTIPLAIHGVVVKGDGTTVEIVVGEDEDDPVFSITDLLPHLAREQMQKKMSEAVTGEGLNLLLGSIPFNDEKVKEKVKLNILSILNKRYGIVEEDFQSAELEIVPAQKARDVGFDKSMIGGYGQDDRVCAYPALRALLDIDVPERTAVCLLTDKEEIGSMGNTGAQSNLLEDFLANVIALTEDPYSDLKVRSCLSRSKMLSADVNAAVDPNYESVYEKRNATYLGHGIVLQKYTGARGKYDASDASAEFVGEVRKLFNDNGIIWQTGELGKVDEGGGGTIAQYAANLGIDVLDCGIAVLSMHSPFEITSKIDIYMTYNAYKVFCRI
ncbi:MAG: aminopeptidase [Acetivibrionales bacterium]|jgi:aspartyl aminopeptidase|nr:aminopeptidase [Bacillota bacterium]HPZ05565.1 aminopeptidase [Clostridiales bacterium]HQD31850.1 aminopeptidase [Clostridiales bacterium]